MSYHHPLLMDTKRKLDLVSKERNLPQLAANLAFVDFLRVLHEGLHRGNACHVMQAISLSLDGEAAGHFLGICQAIYRDLNTTNNPEQPLKTALDHADFMLCETASRMGESIRWRDDLVSRWNDEQAAIDAENA